MIYPSKLRSNFTLPELKLIAKVLNILLATSDHTYGAKLDSFHISRFYSKTHYIDFNEKAGKCRVYKKLKCWAPPEEKFTKVK